MSFEPKLSAVGYYGLQPSTPLLFGSRSPPDIGTGYQSCRSLALWTTATTATNHGVFAAVVGTILNLHELALPTTSSRCAKQLAQPPSGAALVATLYRTFGLSSLKKIRGFFAIILYDTDTDTVYILTDHICSAPVFYVVSPNYLLFSTSLRSLQQYAPLPLAPNLPTIACYLAGFLPAEATFLLDARRVPRNSVLEVTSRGHRIYPYNSLALSSPAATASDFHDAADALRHHLVRAIDRIVTTAQPPISSLTSAGIDSTIIASLLCNVKQRKEFHFLHLLFDTLKYPSMREDSLLGEVEQYLGITVNRLSTSHCEPMSNFQLYCSLTLEGPTIDPNVICFYRALEAAREQGSTFIVVGIGGGICSGSPLSYIEAARQKGIRVIFEALRYERSQWGSGLFLLLLLGMLPRVAAAISFFRARRGSLILTDTRLLSKWARGVVNEIAIEERDRSADHAEILFTVTDFEVEECLSNLFEYEFGMLRSIQSCPICRSLI